MLVALAAVAFVALGIWQYERSQSGAGDFQNLGYALQWPLFAVFAVLAWWRVLKLEHRRETEPAEPAPRPAPRPRPQPVQEDQEEDLDDELAAYNAFLARLAARDAQE